MRFLSRSDLSDEVLYAKVTVEAFGRLIYTLAVSLGDWAREGISIA